MKIKNFQGRNLFQILICFIPMLNIFSIVYTEVWCMLKSKKGLIWGGWQWKFLLCLIPGLIFLMLGLSFVSEKLEILIVYLSCCIWAVSMLLFRYKIK